MQITLKQITIRELVTGYCDNEDDGVRAYGGLLDVRPPYQREFVYKDKQREAVINSVMKGFPLNSMYWADREDGTYEIIDGQQRTISICQYYKGDFSLYIDGVPKTYQNLTKEKQEEFLNYQLYIYVCKGTADDKLDWFKTINIAGERLTDQELRNAVYSGEWLTDAKKYFSKRECPVYHQWKDFLTGSHERQEYLETALKWISNGHITEYMSEHQHDQTALELYNYFQNVMNWTYSLFGKKRAKYMKGVEWGELYNQYKDKSFNPKELQARVEELLGDDDVTAKKGIFSYLITGQEKYLNIRAFSETQKLNAYTEQKGICPLCKEHFELDQMEGDHITPWSEGGKTERDNLQMLCKECNRRKSSK